MIGIIGAMLLGLLLSAMAAVILWRQMERGDVSFGKIIFLVWMPGAIGSLLVIVSCVLLVAKLIKGM